MSAYQAEWDFEALSSELETMPPTQQQPDEQPVGERASHDAARDLDIAVDDLEDRVDPAAPAPLLLRPLGETPDPRLHRLLALTHTLPPTALPLGLPDHSALPALFETMRSGVARAKEANPTGALLRRLVHKPLTRKDVRKGLDALAVDDNRCAEIHARERGEGSAWCAPLGRVVRLPDLAAAKANTTIITKGGGGVSWGLARRGTRLPSRTGPEGFIAPSVLPDRKDCRPGWEQELLTARMRRGTMHLGGRSLGVAVPIPRLGTPQ
jgi:hypothetical protein